MFCVEFGFAESIISHDSSDPELFLFADAIQCYQNISGNPLMIWLIFVACKFSEISDLLHKDYFGFRFVRIYDNLNKGIQSKSPLFVQLHAQPAEHLIDLIMGVAYQEKNNLDFLENTFFNQHVEICHGIFVLVFS